MYLFKNIRKVIKMLSRRSVKGLGFLEFILTMFVFIIAMGFALNYLEGRYIAQEEANRKKAEDAGEKYVPRERGKDCNNSIYVNNMNGC